MGYFNDQAMTTPGMYGSQAVNPSVLNDAGGLGSGFFSMPEGQQAGYNQFVDNFAGGGQSSHFGNFLRNRFGRTQQEYVAQQAQQPDLKFTDYLQNNQGNLQNEYAGMNPQDRGGQQGQRGLRWL